MKNPRRTLGIILRLGIGIGIIALLLTRIDFRQILTVLESTGRHWPWLAAALALLLFALLIGLARWQALLRALDFKIPFGRVFVMYFVGLFFNSFMPGGTGGDILKAYYAARETHHRKTEAITSILIDRIIGLVAISLLVVVMIIVRAGFFRAHPDSLWYCMPAFILCAGALVAVVLLLSINIVERFAFIARWRTRPRMGKIIEILIRAYDAFHVLRRNPRLLAGTLVISVGIHFTIITAEFAVSRALGLRVAYFDFMTLVPVIGVISSIPITPGGVGFRELITIQLFSALGVPQAEALLLSLIPYLGMVLWGLFGGAIFIFAAGTLGRPPPDLEAADPDDPQPAA